ncbi:hypothetical protein [Rhizobium sp. SG_E_25_P2]|uniref:hypothetical protein n=1 Tax=Rhizobium sp. SG_E_25_P2 TaxID=2879942 RepID=UPI002476C7C8|nr:hypothetical protein [Rhizobium sp. SG_E_25_P2]
MTDERVTEAGYGLRVGVCRGRQACINDTKVKANGAVIGAPIGYATAWMMQRMGSAQA